MVELSSVLSNSYYIPSGIASFYAPTIFIGSARIFGIVNKKRVTRQFFPTITHEKNLAVFARLEV